MKISKNLFSLILILTMAFCLSSCNRNVARIFPARPDRDLKPDKDASPEFVQGWNDGCEVGMSAGSNTFYKIFYRNNVVDGYKMTSSSEYKTGWGNAFWYCYRYDYIKQKSSIWGSMFSGYR